jgi:hypothetical protein
MLIAFAPANKMKAFFREFMKRHDSAYSNSANANAKELFHAYGMELLGPPRSAECGVRAALWSNRRLL